MTLTTSPVHFVPKLSGDVLPRFQQQIDALEGSRQAERDALEDKFEAGEIDSKAYREQSRAIDSALRAETRKIGEPLRRTPRLTASCGQ